MTEQQAVPVTEAELQAWLDGELPGDRLEAVEAHLAAHPDDAARLERYREQRSMIGLVYGGLGAGAAGLAGPGRMRRGQAALARAASIAVLAFGLGLAAGWFVHDRPLMLGRPADSTVEFVADALDAHRVFVSEIRHPVEVGADQEQHLLTWLSRRLGTPVAAPSLAVDGFRLIGGRLLPCEQGAAAQFMYQDGSGRRVTLYVRPARTADTAFRLAERGHLFAFYWKDGTLAWALTGDLGRSELLKLAHVAYSHVPS